MDSIDLSSFLRLVWPERLLSNELLELRVIDRSLKEIKTHFYPSHRSVLEAVEKHKAENRYDIYFGVTTRMGPSGKKRDCLRTKTFWADLDGKRLDYEFHKPYPDVIVDSGGGLHAYWILEAPVLLQVDERWKQLESSNRGLAKKFGGDIQCADSARILRVPGTFNFKYQPKRLVKAYEL